MTNTGITDPEVIERRYPVRVREFSIRRDSGGAGRWPAATASCANSNSLALTVSLLPQQYCSR